MYGRFYINREWMVSQTARRVYRASAALALVFVVLISMHLFRAEILDEQLIAPLVGPALLLGMLGSGIVMVAMEYFYFAFDDLSSWRKAVWFFILCFIPIGAVLYCYAVYSRSKYFQTSTDPTAENVPIA